tara:strand:+ start:263 stop:541 length:279 start_codon:yes stop_codon:yes gene_type:complete
MKKNKTTLWVGREEDGLIEPILLCGALPLAGCTAFLLSGYYGFEDPVTQVLLTSIGTVILAPIYLTLEYICLFISWLCVVFAWMLWTYLGEE